MSESRDPHKGVMSCDDVDDPAFDDELYRGRQLLKQGIEYLERLRREYSHFRSLLEELERRVRWHEEDSRRLHESLISLSYALESPAVVASPGEQAGRVVLYIRTLGEFVVHHGERSISLGSNKKGRAIFRYLVTRPERCALRDVLLGLFWPDEQPERAGHKLHIAISSLRGALNDALQDALADEECIIFDEGRYCLNPSIAVLLDADEFIARCQAGDRLAREERVAEAMSEYEAAVALYRGDFLPQDLYADWSLATRARLEEMYLTLLGHLGAFYLEKKQFLEAINCCRQILVRDSFREDAWRLLMRCYSRMGQRNRALREFQVCEEVLRRELGVSPMLETRSLYERILREEEV